MRLQGKIFLVTAGGVAGLAALLLTAAGWLLGLAVWQGHARVWFCLSGLILGGACVSLVTSWIVGKLVVSRLTHLVRVLKGIRCGEASLEGIRLSGDDELAALSASMADVLGDLTCRQERLRAAAQAAEYACRAKSEFVAGVSHEIRTPMTAILGFVNLMASNTGSCSYCPKNACHLRDKNLEYAQTIERNGNYLLEIVNDVLDLSKIEAGRCELEQIESNVAELLDDVRGLMDLRCREKGLSFEVEYASAIPATIHTDPVRLRQILINLLGNAVKFTDCGTVRLVTRYPAHVDAESGRPAQGLIEFDVIDTGIGITPGQMARLFRPFSQGDRTTTRRFGGTGLGLAISKRLAMMLGGDITVASAPGEGSTFRVTVATGCVEGVKLAHPAGRALEPQPPAAAAAAAAPKALDGCRILLAEDGPDNRRLIACLLSKAGADVAMVENGREALEAVAQAQRQGTAFDVVLMDMQMPVLTGYEATRELREQGYALPIIALTAHAMAGDRFKCLAAGCNEYVAKPIDKTQLIRTIAQLTSISLLSE